MPDFDDLCSTLTKYYETHDRDIKNVISWYYRKYQYYLLFKMTTHRQISNI